ncbi:MAG: hypothetical protein ACYCUT_06355 [bacterium]
MINDKFFKEGKAYVYLKGKNKIVVFNESDDLYDFTDALEKAGLDLFHSRLLDENVLIKHGKVYRLGIPTGYGLIEYRFKGKFTANAIDTYEGGGNFIDGESVEKDVLKEYQRELEY